MSSSPGLRHAPVTVLQVLRPSPPRPNSVPPPLPPRRAVPKQSERVPAVRRSVADDVLEALFEALRDLDAEPDALAAARACLHALEEVTPSRASLVHAFDVTQRDFVVVDARGEAAKSMVLQRSTTSDPLLRVAIPSGEPFPWNDLSRAPVVRLGRFTGLPRVNRVLVCPVLAGARWLGAIELVDPAHAGAFRTQDVVAARYVAQRYAQYLSSHGVVLDVAAITRHAFRY